MLLPDRRGADKQKVKQDKHMLFFILVGLFFTVLNIHNLDYSSDLSELEPSTVRSSGSPFKIVKDAADNLLLNQLETPQPQETGRAVNSRSPASEDHSAISEVVSVPASVFNFECSSGPCKKNNEICSHKDQCYSDNCLNNRCQVKFERK